jgi:hypothetical protein
MPPRKPSHVSRLNSHLNDVPLWLLTSNAMPIIRELAGLLKTGIADLQTSMGK